MKFEKFSRISRKYFGELLHDYGFDTERDKSPIFYRKNAEDIYHIVSPKLGSRGVWYDINVFAHSPRISSDFYELFPKCVDIPSDLFSFLNPTTGVGFDQYMYRCRTEEGFIRNFEQLAKPAMIDFAIPYLDSIKTIESLVATISPNLINSYQIPELKLKRKSIFGIKF